jgi:hypothetical protein
MEPTTSQHNRSNPGAQTRLRRASNWRRASLVSAIGVGSMMLAACGSGGGSSTTQPASTSAGAATSAQATGGPAFGSDSTRITNPWLPISKYHRCVLAGNDQGQQLRIVRTLQSRTQPVTFGGQTVNAAVVDDHVTDVAAGQVIEKTVDYFAQDDAGNVYYFGEDVNEYKHGKLVSHEGQWRLGRDTQTPGLLMPANPKPGNPFKSEDVPGITHETDHVVSTRTSLQIGGRTYRNVMKVRENAGPPPEVEYKQYSKGVGVITEANGGVRLVSCR